MFLSVSVLLKVYLTVEGVLNLDYTQSARLGVWKPARANLFCFQGGYKQLWGSFLMEVCEGKIIST